ncbi:Hypothetical protein NTJ_10207 [Nesidiocoris tenuis]|uniref:Uncharacterized protein n=1 Tax=Nesidiocoris tenuis TaxID=355587 RepID=A0ABN7AZ05_9HEMI|nr:Hypothetical protein NTJ_10207 [Nesidiocoris tenuis]
MGDPEDSLRFPTDEEQMEIEGEPQVAQWNLLPEPKDLSTEQIERLLQGLEVDPFMDPDDLREVLLRRQHEMANGPFGFGYYILPLAFVVVGLFAFFGWKLYKSLKEREMKKEEKKRLKQKKKK